MEKDSHNSQKETVSPPLMKFTEHQGLETDMTGLRVWYCELTDKQYAIWEIPRKSLPSYMAKNLAPGKYCYRLNWRPYGIYQNPFDWEPWQYLSDCHRFDKAERAANEHASNSV